MIEGGTSAWPQNRRVSPQERVKGKSVYDITSRGRLVRSPAYMLLCTRSSAAPGRPAGYTQDERSELPENSAC